MGKKTKEIIGKGIGVSLIPATCAYLSQDNNILTWLQDNGYIGSKINIDFIQNSMSIMSILLTFILLTVPYILSDLRCKSYKSQRDILIKSNKDIFETTLKHELNLEHCKLNVRIFVPRLTIIQSIRKKFKLSNILYYHIKNINGLAEKDITDNLKFQVFPNKQGLVGECYVQKAVLYDDDMENSNETNYNLTHYQIAKTNKLKFILVCPIFSEAEEIIAIISLDSEDTIKMQEGSKDTLRKLVLNYTQSLYECIPDLFKAKGGII